MAFLGAWGQWYEEAEHPRGSGGRWTSKGGGGAQPRARNPIAIPTKGTGRLSQREYDAVDLYVDLGESINQELARGRLSKDSQQTVRAIDGIMRRTLTRFDTTVFRGISPKAANTFSKAEGKVVTLKTYSSTSRDPRIAQEFATGPVLQIDVPRGSHGLDLSQWQGEQEFLLPRNSKVRVDTVEGDKIKLTLLGAKPSYERDDVGASLRRLRTGFDDYPTKEELEAEEAAEKAALKEVRADNRRYDAEQKAWREKVEADATRIASAQGFRGRMRFTPYPRAEYSQGAIGEYNPQTRTIHVYTGPLWWQKPEVARGVIAHEIQHDKFSTVIKEYKAGKHKELDRFLKEGPLHDELLKSGRISKYAYEYWGYYEAARGYGTKAKAKGWKERAIDETLAEVALRKQRGAFRKPKARRRERNEEGWWHDVPKVWNDLYNAIDKIYQGTARPSDEELIREKKEKSKFLGIYEPTEKELQQAVAKAKKVVTPIAEKLGFNTDNIVYHTTSRGGALAGYDPWTGKIDLWRRGIRGLAPKALRATMAHEIQHHKYTVVQQAYEQGKKSPVYALVAKHFDKANLERLREVGGVSGYSDDYWKSLGKSERKAEKTKGLIDEVRVLSDYEAAIDETLAEIAAHDLDPDTERTIPKIWRDFYNDIDAAYKKLGGAKAKTYGQTVIPLIEADNAKIKAEQKKLRDEIKATVRGGRR